MGNAVKYFDALEAIKRYIPLLERDGNWLGWALKARMPVLSIASQGNDINGKKRRR
jgi:hypothetical protein